MRRRATILAATLLAVAVRLSADDVAGRQFMWNEGNARAAAARTPREFAAAADAYRRLAASGGANGLLFYNLGTASLKAERCDEAVAALLRAERYLGTTPEIERNLTLALAGAKRGSAGAMPWHRLILFWHHGLPASRRAALGALAFSGIWLGLALRLLGWRGAGKGVVAIALIALMLFGSSALTSLQEESRARRSDAVATAAAKPVRTGP